MWQCVNCKHINFLIKSLWISQKKVNRFRYIVSKHSQSAINKNRCFSLRLCTQKPYNRHTKILIDLEHSCGLFLFVQCNVWNREKKKEFYSIWWFWWPFAPQAVIQNYQQIIWVLSVYVVGTVQMWGST